MTVFHLHDSLPTSARHIIILSLLYLLLLFPHEAFAVEKAVQTEATSQIEQSLMQYLVCSPVASTNKNKEPLIAQTQECLATIYLGTGKKPLWVTAEGLSEDGWVILHYLKYSGLHGLNVQKYKLDQILTLLPSNTPDDLAKLDTLLSYGLVRYMHDITQGQFEPRLLDPKLFAEAGELDFDPLLAIQRCLAAPDLNAFLNNLAPNHHHYTLLKKGLEKYREIKRNGGWLSIPTGATLHPGDTDPRIKAVRLRLLKTDYTVAEPPAELSSYYDNDLRAAVIRFQLRHSLEPDGLIGSLTTEAMNVSVSERIETIRLNMARWHWQAHYLGERYIIVNTAAFHLRAIDGETVELELPVIVGKFQHQTPVFSDTILYLDFNPFWTITPNIAKNEELPKLRENPNYLVEKHVRLFSGWQENDIELDSTLVDWAKVTPKKMASLRLRQDPGPWNALGKLKFVFPNSYDIYIHGTPAQDLFNHNTRDFSHGCIRVSDPLALARFTLQGQDGNWTSEKIRETYKQNDRKTVSLSQPLPVHITYLTAWVDKNDTIHFNNDVYARDSKLRKALYK